MSRAVVLGCAALGSLLATPELAWAWDDFGHMEVAAVAYGSLTQAAKKRASALLRLNPSYPNWIVGARSVDRDRAAFLRAATWADAIKNDGSVHTDKDDKPTLPTATRNDGYDKDPLRHRYWHYVNLPFSPDGTPLVPSEPPNVQTQIALFRSVLATPGGDDGLKSYDLSWLLHLVGDVHQPLHCVARFDKEEPAGDQGGNLVKISGNTAPAICDDPRYCPYPPTSDLHAFWDVLTGESYAVAEVNAAAAALPRINPRSAKAKILDESAWVQEGLELAQSKVYVAPIGVGKGPFPVDAAYQKAAVTLARERISLAGARLANILNDCFAREAAKP
jgi:hypothetical protein